MTIIEEIVEKLRHALGEDTIVTCMDVKISIKKRNASIGMVFVLNEENLPSSDIQKHSDRIANQILKEWNEGKDCLGAAKMIDGLTHLLDNKEDFLNSMQVCLLSKEATKAYEESCLKKDIENSDMCIVIKSFVGEISATVKKTVLDRFNMTESEIWERAWKNVLFSSKIIDCDEVIKDIFEIPEYTKAFLVGRNDGYCGASSIMEKHVLNTIHLLCSSDDILMVPIHADAVVVFPNGDFVNKDFINKIKTLQRDANLIVSEVLNEKINLSDNVYIHNTEKGWRIYE